MALLLAVPLVACSSDASAGLPLEISVQLTSQEQVLHRAGASDEIVYGWNRLTGSTEIEGLPAEVELLGSVDYVSGNGDFLGFVTVTLADGSILGIRLVDGQTRAATDTTDASFSSDLRVIGGTGKYEGVGGDGKFEGTRKAALGGAVDSVFRLELNQP